MAAKSRPPLLGIAKVLLTITPLVSLFALLYVLLFLPRRLLRALARRHLRRTLDATAGSGMPLSLFLCEAPLALVSYWSYLAYKGLVTPIVRAVQAARDVGTHAKWTDKLYENIVDPGTSPQGAVCAAIAWGPRWNTHTNVHFVHRRMPASGEATFEVENVQTPGFSWQVGATQRASSHHSPARVHPPG